MIVTVTPNPAYDATYEIPALVPGEVHRVATTHLRPGGKGINVASVLLQLGSEVTATGFASDAFAVEVARLGITERFVPVLPHVRRTVAVVEPQRTTSLWEPGVPPPDPQAAVSDLCRAVDDLMADARCLVVSGSLPPETPPTLPADLAGAALRRGVPALVDTSGEALRLASVVRGVVLMPNADELTQLTGAGSTVDEVVAASRSLVERGVAAVYATRGADGLVVTTGAGSWLVTSPVDVPGNPTGAGDAAAAAVAHGLAGGRPHHEIAELAVAVSAAAVAEPVAGRLDVEVQRHVLDGVITRSWVDAQDGDPR